jgi:hypothetical protein
MRMNSRPMHEAEKLHAALHALRAWADQQNSELNLIERQLVRPLSIAELELQELRKLLGISATQGVLESVRALQAEMAASHRRELELTERLAVTPGGRLRCVLRWMRSRC